MRLQGPAVAPEGTGPFDLGWFHAFVMVLLTAFAAAMILMYFHKMRRAGALLADLAQGGARRRQRLRSPLLRPR